MDDLAKFGRPQNILRMMPARLRGPIGLTAFDDECLAADALEVPGLSDSRQDGYGVDADAFISHGEKMTVKDPASFLIEVVGFRTVGTSSIRSGSRRMHPMTAFSAGRSTGGNLVEKFGGKYTSLHGCFLKAGHWFAFGGWRCMAVAVAVTVRRENSVVSCDAVTDCGHGLGLAPFRRVRRVAS